MSQNTSSAVMAQRREPPGSLDFFPTPPWATRALLEQLYKLGFRFAGNTVWEPACGEGHMVRPLSEQFGRVIATDVFDYGRGYGLHDFLGAGGLALSDAPHSRQPVGWVITNPPFNAAAEFARIALQRASCGVALLCRTAFAEGQERYRDLFKPQPEAWQMPFVERVVMHKGVLRDPDKLYWDEAAQQWRRPSSATAYSWFVWLQPDASHAGREAARLCDPRLRRIPPCRRRLERRPGDYDDPFTTGAPTP